MKYYEAKFTFSPYSDDAADLLAALIADAGFESFNNDGEKLLAYVQTTLYDESMLNDIISTFPLSDVKINFTVSEVEDQDWNATWEQQGFDPIIIGKECIVYDANHPESIDGMVTDWEQPMLVAIEARQAFGTGTHQTTQMIVERLLHSNLGGKRLLDCGCGTGILSIVASKCGALDVVGYDIDEWSVRNTQHNAELNDVDNITVYEGDSSVLSHVSGLFDVVVANINRNILLGDMSRFVDVMLPHAHLILSGFYEDDADILVNKAHEFNLTEIYREITDSWTMLEFVRK
jgi:ribosomal protein L11 methyltransferase